MQTLIRWLGWILAVVLAVAIIALVAIYAISGWRINRTYAIEPEPVSIPAADDRAAIARGEYLVKAITKCVDCHGAGLEGDTFNDDLLFGRLIASNLTAGEGGVGRDYTDADWVRSIRHGVGPDGKPLLFMPSVEYYPLSDADLSALIAYVKSVPPVDNPDLPGNRVGPLGRFLFLSGQLDLLPAEKIDHDAPRPDAPAAGRTVAYGRYLATTGGCIGCHGPTFSGGPIPGAPPEIPPARNLTPDAETGLGAWTIADFEIALRTGKRPDGTQLSEFMPWKATARMTDQDLEAVWLFLRSLPPKPWGGR